MIEHINNLLRKKSAGNSQLACLVCSHVSKNPANVGFLINDGEGYAAACCEECGDYEAGERLGMVHLGHILSADKDLLDIGGLPVNIAVAKRDGQWAAKYFFLSYTPEEGDFLAPPEGSDLFKLKDDTLVLVYRRRGGRLVTATLDEAFRVIPFWRTRKDSQQFGDLMDTGEYVDEITLVELRNQSRHHGVRFLAPDFLSMLYDYALIA